jgi:hypothetical protein
MRPTLARLAPSLVLALATGAARADDAPAFDRPGLSFAAAVLPAGSFDWEQGLPDFERDSADGVRTTTYAASTEFRLGLGHALEVQLAGSPWNRVTVRDHGAHASNTGAGDTRVAVKWAPPLSTEGLSFALLGAVSFDTGSAESSSGTTVSTLGVVLSRDLGDGRSVGGYLNVDHDRSSNVVSSSLSYGFPVNDAVGGFVEVGHSSGGGPSTGVAGGGLTWLVDNRLQLDLSAHVGLTSNSPDLDAGFGISYFWP